MTYQLSAVIFLALVLHILLIIYGEWQDEHFEVKYTDVDYHVFTDAAKYVLKGKSPFERHTYRYTPLLAYMMVPNVLVHRISGKLLFSVFNIATGFVIYKISQILLRKDSSLALFCAVLWMFNPLTFAVSTRGSAESLMTFLVTCTVYLLYRKSHVLSGLLYGFSIHFKLYPVVYALPILIHLCFRSNEQITIRKFMKSIFLTNSNLRKFVFSALLASAIPTLISYWLYSDSYYQEALLYHVSRRDIRHNFSPYFYMLYLTDHWANDVVAMILFVPQVVLLITFAVKYSFGNDILFCLFCETFVFVMFNKVCTSQYFLWFLCLLPPLVPHFRMSFIRFIALLGIWFGGQAMWLYVAYQVEFLGSNMFLTLWAASLLFLVINCCVLCEMIKFYKITKWKNQ